MDIATIVFLALALVAVAAAVGMLVTRNTVYSALLLIVNFGTIALLYLILGAPFIALAQVTVYAGAIMVLFLFVIMVLGTDRAPLKETLRRQRPMAITLGVGILAEALYILVFKGGPQPPLLAPPANSGNPADIGTALFNGYMLPFEITSVILLVATVGAIVLTKEEKKPLSNREQGIKDQSIKDQGISDQSVKDQESRDAARAISDQAPGGDAGRATGNQAVGKQLPD